MSEDRKLQIGFWLVMALVFLSGIAGLFLTKPIDGIG